MTDDNEVKARQTAHGLIQGYIGPDHKVNRYEGVLLGAGTGSERGAPYVYIAVKIARFGPSLDVGSWHLADINRDAEHVCSGAESGHLLSGHRCVRLGARWWDTRARKHNDHMGPLTVPLFAKSLMQLI
jgi:hypothetical protein